jgi:NAD(P)H-dependent FMN reductase
MKVLIFSGSARQGNFTQHVANLVLEVAQQHPELEADLVSPESLGLTFDGEGRQANKKYPDLTEKVVAADAYIIVSPEYNHGYPGSLKYMLDLHLKEYIHKPVAFVGVSMMQWGGTRMIEHLTSIVREMGMVATFTDTNVTMVQEEVVDGKFTDDDKWRKRINRTVTELVWMAQTLKHGRDNIPSEYHS